MPGCIRVDIRIDHGQPGELQEVRGEEREGLERLCAIAMDMASVDYVGSVETKTDLNSDW